jgi:tRNA pseudouridine55 synthase
MPTPKPTDGFLLVDKPADISSHDVVAAVRRALGESRVGHAGTLDPFATGLLVVCVGRATRLLPHIPGEPKVYEATIHFGAETDTEDLHGTVVRHASPPTRDALLQALPRFVGTIQQVPPAYSAKRIGGKRAYALARAGEDVPLQPVSITVHRWDLLDTRPDADGRVCEADVRITCAGGTYVRSLARDLARAVGSAAHLVALRRISSGPFHIADAVSLTALQDGEVALRPPLEALVGFPTQSLSDDDVLRIVRGVPVPASVLGTWGALVRGEHPVLVALAERRADTWQPRVVMREA